MRGMGLDALRGVIQQFQSITYLFERLKMAETPVKNAIAC